MSFLRSAVVLAAVLYLTVPARAIPTDFAFQDVEIREIFQTIAVLGKFNVLVDPQIARAKLVVSLRQVEPLDAMYAIAKIEELVVRRVRWEEGTTTITFAIGRADKIERYFEGANVRTLQLRFARAADVAALIEAKLPKTVNLGVNADGRTNRLILHGSESVLEKVANLVRDVDLPIPAVNAKLSLLAGPPDRPAAVWSGSSLVVQGACGRVSLTTTGSKGTASWRVVRLAGEISHRVNSDNFCTVTVSLHAALDKNGAGTEIKLEGEAQVRDGEEIAIGTVEVAPGEVVQLRVKPEVLKYTPVAEPEKDEPEKSVETGKPTPDPGRKLDGQGKPTPDPGRKLDGLDLDGL